MNESLVRLERRGRGLGPSGPSRGKTHLLALAVLAVASCLAGGCAGPGLEGEVCQERCVSCGANDCEELCGPASVVPAACQPLREELRNCLLSAPCETEPECEREERDYLLCSVE